MAKSSQRVANGGHEGNQLEWEDDQLERERDQSDVLKNTGSGGIILKSLS